MEEKIFTIVIMVTSKTRWTEELLQFWISERLVTIKLIFFTMEFGMGEDFDDLLNMICPVNDISSNFEIIIEPLTTNVNEGEFLITNVWWTMDIINYVELNHKGF